jgi:hypothetical protein
MATSAEKNQRYRKRKNAGHPRILCEGDSWFGYPVYTNLIDFIDRWETYAIKRCEKNGDTLEEIMYTGEFYSLIDREEPEALVFCGGGNDLVDGAWIEDGPGGPGLFNPYTPGASARDLLNAAVWQGKLDRFRELYETLVRMVDRRCPIVAHGYDNLIPSEAGVRYDGIRVTGPWVRPAMAHKGIVDAALQATVAKEVVGDFNEMLGRVAAAHPGWFVHVDLRGTLDPGDWANEMHPTRRGFEKVARKFLNEAKRAGALP